MRKFTLTALFLPITALVYAQAGDSAFIRRISDEILVNGKAYDNLRYLTKQIGGRLAGSPGMVKAEKWGQARLQASGADKVWLQECMVPHWVRGGKDEATAFYLKAVAGKGAGVSRISKSLDAIALGNSIGSGRNGLQADVVEIQSFEELDAKNDKVKGKIVFYNVKFNPAYVSTFLAYRDAARYRTTGAGRAARYGATGIILRSMSHGANNIPHTGAMRYDTAYAKIPAVAIGLQDADWLSETLKTTPVNATIKTYGRFLPDTIGHNVIGELKGTEFPNEIITVGGHLDSWDNCEGAHDDGAGVVQTIEILRAYKALGYKPKHTIRFVLFANEENGLRGADKYAEEAVAKNEKHIFALESDAGGFTPRGFSFTVSDAQFEKVMKWKELLEPYGCSELTRGGGGADIGPLNEKLKTPLSGLSPDSQRYFDYHHARNDVFEAVNKRELELGAINMAALIYLVDQYGL
jgi:carboxypeptidase Q